MGMGPGIMEASKKGRGNTWEKYGKKVGNEGGEEGRGNDLAKYWKQVGNEGGDEYKEARGH